MGKVTIIKNTNLEMGSGVIELRSKKKSDLKKLKDGVFATDDPSLILILNVLHGHEVISTGYLEGYHNTHFVFAQNGCLQTHLKDWNEVARDDCSGSLNLVYYMAATLDELEKDSFSKLMQDLETFDKDVDN